MAVKAIIMIVLCCFSYACVIPVSWKSTGIALFFRIWYQLLKDVANTLRCVFIKKTRLHWSPRLQPALVRDDNLFIYTKGTIIQAQHTRSCSQIDRLIRLPFNPILHLYHHIVSIDFYITIYIYIYIHTSYLNTYNYQYKEYFPWNIDTFGDHYLLKRSLQWRHNGRDGVSNHQPRHCLLNRLFRRRSKKTSKFRIAGLCAGKSPVTGEFPAKWPVLRKIFHLMTSPCVY